MRLRQLLSLVLAAGIACVGMPVFAQDFGANTVWGEVPQDVANKAANAVLQDAAGRTIAQVPVIDGKFAFLNVSPGEYTVVIQDGAAKTLATSQTAVLTEGATVRAVFGGQALGGPPPVTGGGVSGTAIVVAAGAAVGLGVAIVAISQNDDKPASPSR
jgi:hypothetical protein